MSNSNKPSVRLHELTPGQTADFYALLSEKVRGARRDGKPYFTCRFRDAGRVEACERHWQQGRFYKVSATYQEHPTYGPQIDLFDIRPVTSEDQKHGFEPT